jgi:hypothetical protein
MIAAGDIDADDSAGHGIEAGGKDDGLGPDALVSARKDGRLPCAPRGYIPCDICDGIKKVCKAL